MNNKKRRDLFWWLFAITIGMSSFGLASLLAGFAPFPDSDLLGSLALMVGPFWMLGGTISHTPESRSRTSRILARVAAGLFVLSLFLPAVNMTPWLPGFNLFGLSFYGTIFFGLGLVTHGVTDGVPELANFVTCLVGASANVLMLTTIFRINRGRPVPVQITALTLVLTLAAAGGLCYLHRSIADTFSFGYFAWVGCAALLIAGSITQPTRADLR